MNKEKQLYEAPTAQTFVVRFEGAILTVSGQGNTIQNGTMDDWDVDL